MTNVLKKIIINPLIHFHLWEEVAEYKAIENDEQMAAFYHKMLTRFERRPLVVKFIYEMIAFSTSYNINSKIPKEI